MFINIYENTASFDLFAEMCDKYTHTHTHTLIIIIIKKTPVEKLHTVRFLTVSNVNVVVSNRPNGVLLTSGTAPAEILGH